MDRFANPNAAFAALGLPPGADEPAILEARRTLAKQKHPDAGGSVDAMQELNEAVETALSSVRSTQSSDSDTTRPSRRRPAPSPRGAFRQDHPSFTVEALPVEVFEAMLLVAAELGVVIDEDPPYLLEVKMASPIVAWCRLEIVPDAGAATVSITTARTPGHPTPDIYEVRDAWIDALNRRDWDEEGPAPPP